MSVVLNFPSLAAQSVTQAGVRLSVFQAESFDVQSKSATPSSHQPNVKYGTVVFAQGHRPQSKRQGYECIVYLFPPMCCGFCVALTWLTTNVDSQ